MLEESTSTIDLLEEVTFPKQKLELEVFRMLSFFAMKFHAKLDERKTLSFTTP
jgi:hypothetical protein